jgi:hypothetical protein
MKYLEKHRLDILFPEAIVKIITHILIDFIFQSSFGLQEMCAKNKTLKVF